MCVLVVVGHGNRFGKLFNRETPASSEEAKPASPVLFEEANLREALKSALGSEMLDIYEHPEDFDTKYQTRLRNHWLVHEQEGKAIEQVERAVARFVTIPAKLHPFFKNPVYRKSTEINGWNCLAHMVSRVGERSRSFPLSAILRVYLEGRSASMLYAYEKNKKQISARISMCFVRTSGKKGYYESAPSPSKEQLAQVRTEPRWKT